MKLPVIEIVLALFAASFTGCGTVCNFAGGVVHPEKEPKIYGGVQRDMEIIEKAVTTHPDNPPNMGKAAVVVLAVALVDPIVSFVADTLTLPITIPIQLWRERAEKSDDTSGSNSSVSSVPLVSLGPPGTPN